MPCIVAKLKEQRKEFLFSPFIIILVWCCLAYIPVFCSFWWWIYLIIMRRESHQTLPFFWSHCRKIHCCHFQHYSCQQKNLTYSTQQSSLLVDKYVFFIGNLYIFSQNIGIWNTAGQALIENSYWGVFQAQFWWHSPKRSKKQTGDKERALSSFVIRCSCFVLACPQAILILALISPTGWTILKRGSRRDSRWSEPPVERRGAPCLQCPPWP